MTSRVSDRRSYIAGEWVDGEESFAVENPADESVVCELPATPAVAVEAAVGAARSSFDSGIWSDRSPQERAEVVRRFLQAIAATKDELVALLVAEAGQPLRFAEQSQYGAGLAVGFGTIELYLSLQHEQNNPVPVDELTRGRVALSIRRYEPVGVVTAITPYNAALMMAIQKLVPALLTGNSVILRPSPLTPLSSLLLGRAADEAGLPPGILSVVVEPGSSAAEVLTTHPDVDMVSFTGSTAVGRAILAQAAPTVKHVALELGGKSAQIYLPDALDQVVTGALMVVGSTAGQACVAATRMLVPEQSKAEVVERVAAAYGSLTVGPPDDPKAAFGPLINAAARERCERIVAEAEQAGGKAVTGGGRPGHLPRGYYFEPTVLDVPDNDNPSAQQEIFGPVLTVIGYRNADDAVKIANDSAYGLSGQVYGRDVAAATAIARRIRSGAVNVNMGGLFTAAAPSGGYKQSGLGRERGVEGIRAFQEIKHLAIGQLPS